MGMGGMTTTRRKKHMYKLEAHGWPMTQGILKNLSLILNSDLWRFNFCALYAIE